jgi:hypothetical protein
MVLSDATEDKGNEENESDIAASDSAFQGPLERRMLDENVQFLASCLEAATNALDFDVDPDKVRDLNMLRFVSRMCTACRAPS